MAMDLAALRAEISDLTKKLSDPEFLSNPAEAKKAGKRLQNLQKQSDLLASRERVEKSLQETEQLLGENLDPEMLEMAQQDKADLIYETKKIDDELEELERRPAEELPDDLIMEIRAGTGGQEAALFARDLYEMYTKYAVSKDWDVALVSTSESELGGFKEVVFEINGEGAYKALRQESGVHRIQRIPETEKQGRIHTSTATVAVLPQVEDLDVEVRPQDIKVEFYRSSGPGGQNVNKVETAVRIIHLPTGLVITSQEGRSQLKNRERAMTILRAKLYEAKREAEERKMAAERKQQIGGAERAEKIRTYNVPQDRVTDHRINESWHNIEGIFEGKIEEIVAAFQKR